MPRPGVWKRKSDGWYYTTHGGRKVRLSRDYRESLRLFAQLKADPAPRRQQAAPTVAELLDRFLDHCHKTQSARTYKMRLDHLQDFADTHGGMPADLVKPLHLTAWLDRPTWGATTRAIHLASVKRAFAWATDEGFLHANPIARAKGPRPQARPPVAPDVARAAIDAAPPHLAEFLRGLAETGCRPGELASATVADLDAMAGTLRVRGKTGARTVYLGPAALKLAVELAERHQDGPLWRNSHGDAWTPAAWRHGVRKIAASLGVDLVAYHFRGLWASEAIARGVDGTVVAAMLGHVGTDMIMRHYAHHQPEALRDAARRARGEG